MLDGLDHIPWSTLEHAYGDAGDIPNLIRALVSSDPDERAWAQDMLYMGPFHQGSIYSCTPFVIRVLLQIVQEKDAAETPWILQYVSQVVAAAIWLLRVPEPLTQDLERDSEQDLEQAHAAQILVEIRAQWPLLWSMLEHPDGHIRLALLRLLVLLKTDLPHLAGALAQKLNGETDESTRAALVFCLSLVADNAPLSSIQEMLETATESPLVRMAAGFGLICAVKEHIASGTLTAFCDVIANNLVALNGFERIYAEYLTPLGAPPGNERLLECLQQGWSARQRDQIVQALLHIYAHLPISQSFGTRIGCAYYLEAMVRLGFPDGRLAPETTIRDLNDIQRRILEAFQQYDVPSIEWNVYGPSDYRDILGFDFRSESDFLDFMAGERPAKRTKP